MNKLFITISFLLIALSIFVFLPTNGQPTYQDCYEFGECKSGEQIYINDKKVTITKEYCVNNNYKWYEDTQVCYIR